MSAHSLANLVGTNSHRGHIQAQKPDEEPEYRAFSFGRVGQKPQIRLQFRKADGYHLMLPYIDLKPIESMDPEKGFIMEFASHKITIEGQNLLECYGYLGNDRLALLAEAPRAQVLSMPASEPLITSMRIEKNTATRRNT